MSCNESIHEAGTDSKTGPNVAVLDANKFPTIAEHDVLCPNGVQYVLPVEPADMLTKEEQTRPNVARNLPNLPRRMHVRSSLSLLAIDRVSGA